METAAVEFNLYGKVARLQNTPGNAGRTCHVKGIVSHVSTIRPGVIVLAKMEIPYRGGIPIHLPEGVQMPESGDEIWVEGVTAPIAGRMGIAATNFAKIDFRPPDFVTKLNRHQDLRNGRLTYRRVHFAGRVRSVGKQDGFIVLGVSMGDKIVHVRVPARPDQSRWIGRNVELVGCVFPVEGSNGETIAYCIEVEDADDVHIVDGQMDDKTVMVLMWIVGAILSLAFLAALVAWIRSRRERLKLETVAAERKRMATDLHDTIEQHLAGVKIMLAAALRSEGVPEKTREMVMRANDMLAYAKGEVRVAVMDMRGDISTQSIRSLLQEIADGVNRAGAVRVRMALRGLPNDLGRSRTQNLVMIVREAVTNAVKHGRAKLILLVADPLGEVRGEELGARGCGGFVLRILNDGEPFDRSAALGPETGHYGLAGMEERAKRGNFVLSFGVDGKWTYVKLVVLELPTPNSQLP